MNISMKWQICCSLWQTRQLLIDVTLLQTHAVAVTLYEGACCLSWQACACFCCCLGCFNVCSMLQVMGAAFSHCSQAQLQDHSRAPSVAEAVSNLPSGLLSGLQGLCQSRFGATAACICLRMCVSQVAVQALQGIMYAGSATRIVCVLWCTLLQLIADCSFSCLKCCACCMSDTACMPT